MTRKAQADHKARVGFTGTWERKKKCKFDFILRIQSRLWGRQKQSHTLFPSNNQSLVNKKESKCKDQMLSINAALYEIKSVSLTQ